MNTPELESILRAAPRPPAPAGLQQRLVSQVRLPAAGTNGEPVIGGNWFRRWWPTLLFGGGVLACAATLLTQQGQIRELRAQLEAAPEAQMEPGVVASGSRSQAAPALPESTSSTEDKRAEILRLRAELAELKAGSALAEQLTAENRQLETQIAAQSGLTAEDLEAMEAAKAKSQSIQCVNNLKNIGLALRIWATDNQDTFPMDLLSLTNELSTPKLLACPSDTGRSVAPNWASFGPGNLSYEFLAPGGTDAEPTCVAARCLIHRHIALSDGSVQQSVGDGSNLSRRYVNRNGKLYLE
jgi:hypothetical protein